MAIPPLVSEPSSAYPVEGREMELQSYRILDMRLLVHSESNAMAAHIHRFARNLEVSDAIELDSLVRLAIFKAPRKNLILCSPESGVATVVKQWPDAWLSFRRLYMHWVLNMGRPHYPMHACCVADGKGKAVVISGTSGAGKTSLTAALLQRGFSFVADDYLLFLESGEVIALPVGSTVSDRTISAIPELSNTRDSHCRLPGKNECAWTINFGDVFPCVQAYTTLLPTHFFFVTPQFGKGSSVSRCSREESVWQFQTARFLDAKTVKPMYGLQPHEYYSGLDIAMKMAGCAEFYRVSNGNIQEAADLMCATIWG